MIHHPSFRLFLTATLMSLATVMSAYPVIAGIPDDDDDDDKKTVIDESALPIPIDSTYYLRMQADSLRRAEQGDPEEPFAIEVLARAYGDSIALRWAPSEYVPWKYLNGYGYDIFRGCVSDDNWSIDSIAYVRAWNRYKFQEVFAANDTLAGGAVECIFGEGTTLTNTNRHPGSAGSVLEVYEEQQNVFGFAMFIAEARPDLAKAMGLMYVDRDVKPGKDYLYFIKPHMADSVLRVGSGSVRVANTPYKADACTLEMTDSLTSVNSVSLTWPFSTYSAFNIERRRQGESTWTVINTKPYISMSMDFLDPEPASIFVDEDLQPGTYYYRLRGLDSFGNWSAPSPEHEVVMPDLIPPTPPVIKHITIDRGEGVMSAAIDFHKDQVEPDLVGYIPFYQFNVANEEGEEQDISTQTPDSVDISQGWVPLLKDRLVAPRDSSVTVDISGLSSGMVTIAAVDTAMNMTYAMPMPIRIVDLVPPEAPSNLRTHVSVEGVVTLLWSPSPSLDTHFYEVFLANDTTHQFMLAAGNQILRDTVWRDTLSMQVNQAYKYYKVRAVDFSGNSSEFSPIHQCVRPNFNAPSECWSDSIWQDDDHVYTRWHLSPEKDVADYHLYRRLTNEKQCTLVQGWERKDIVGDVLVATDSPAPQKSQRYYYAMTASNLTGVSTGLSQAICILHRGQLIIPIDIKLEGGWRSEDGKTVLAWSIPEELPVVAPFHFVIERQLEGEDFFRPYRSADYDNRTYTDQRLKEGQSTKYRIKMLYEDGRSSTWSNEVSIVAKKK